MFTRQKNVPDGSNPQVHTQSRRKSLSLRRKSLSIARAAIVNKGRKRGRPKLNKIDESEPTKTTARVKRSASVNLPSPLNNSKRKIETTDPNKSKKQKITEAGQIARPNTCCWICHKIGQDRVCVCTRVYHNECLAKASLAFRYNKCPECQHQHKSTSKSAPTRPFTEELRVYLESAIKLITDKHKKKKLSWSQNTDEVGAINMKTLLHKVKDNEYKTTHEFFSDVKWLEHNSCVRHGEHSKKSKDMKIVVKDFKEELYDMEACPECYYYLNCVKGNDSDGEKQFVRLCNPPHDIVWARVTGHSYWPAKVLKVTNGKARVRFFGRHEKADVGVNTIFHISESHPTHDHRNIGAAESRTALDYTYAKKELCDYIRIYERRIGRFQFFGFRVFYTSVNDSARSGNEAQRITEQGFNQARIGERNVNSDTSSAFHNYLPLTATTRVPSEPCPPTISSSNEDVSVNMTFNIEPSSSVSNHRHNNFKNYPSASIAPLQNIETIMEQNTPGPSSPVNNYRQNNFRNYPSMNIALLQNIETIMDRSTPSDYSSFPSSVCTTPRSTPNLGDVQVKHELIESGEQSRISALDPNGLNQFNLIRIVQDALFNTASSLASRSFLDARPDEKNQDLSIVKEEILDSAPSTSGTDKVVDQSDVVWTENVPSIVQTNTIYEPEIQIETLTTENVPGTSAVNETQDISNANCTEALTNSRDSIPSHIPSDGIIQPEEESNNEVQQQEISSVPSTSSKEIPLIDLTEEEDDKSNLTLPKLLTTNPQMKQLLEETQKAVGKFLIRVCEEVSYRQKPETQLCNDLQKKLNETEKKFQQETEMLRNELKRLQENSHK